MFSELVDGVENVKFVARNGVNLSHDLIHANECSRPTNTSTAVDQERTSVRPQGVSGEEDVGELDNGDQVTPSARGAPVRPVCQLEVDHNTITVLSRQIGLTCLCHIKLAYNIVGSLITSLYITKNNNFPILYTSALSNN